MLTIQFILSQKTWAVLLIQAKMMPILLWKERSKEVSLRVTESLVKGDTVMIFMNFKMHQYFSI